MIGSYHVTVSNRYLKYEFDIKRNITVIKGNSATGKTTLLEMIREHNEEEDSGITVQCEKRCVILYGKDWEGRLQEIHDSIVFIDETGVYAERVLSYLYLPQRNDSRVRVLYQQQPKKIYCQTDV